MEKINYFFITLLMAVSCTMFAAHFSLTGQEDFERIFNVLIGVSLGFMTAGVYK